MMEWALILIISVAGSVQTTQIPFKSSLLCKRALDEIRAAPPSMGGNAYWVGQPTTQTGESTAQNHEILLRGAYCVETGA